jgi:hypothetical protein
VIGISGPQTSDDQIFGSGVSFRDGVNRALEANVGKNGAWESLAYEGASLVTDRDGSLKDGIIVHERFLVYL